MRDRSFGVQGGIAAERELIDGLALRLSLRLARLSFESGTTRQQGVFGDVHDKEFSGHSLGLIADPSLSLYFYF